MNTKHPNRSERLKLIDLSIDLISLCFSIPAHNASYVKSVIRAPEVLKFYNELSSGGKVSSELVDAAVQCVENANEVQIEEYYRSIKEREDAKHRNHIDAEKVKQIIKDGLRSQERLLEQRV